MVKFKRLKSKTVRGLWFGYVIIKNQFEMRLKPVLCGIIMLGMLSCQHTGENYTKTIDLSGSWAFELDSNNVGLEEKWFSKQLTDNIQLPGTTDENEKGIFLDERAVDRLSRVWYWKGPAWYQKEVEIPEDWDGKHVQLLLERTKDTHVWVNGKFCGYDNTLSAPQYYDLSEAVTPGKNQITILIDNAKLPPVGPSHAVDERTQTNWNGIVGRMELQATDPVWIEEVQAYPDVENNSVNLRVTIGNITNTAVEGTLTLSAESWNTDRPNTYKEHKENLNSIQNMDVVEITYNFNIEAPLWNEFDPALIQLSLTLSANTSEANHVHSKQIDFGMRSLVSEGKHFFVNGERIFLRGRLDCANYPLTGYAPMDRETWLEMFKQLKSYGINHWRFHSWFPPREALMAADMVGVYLQPELPNKRSGMDTRSMEEEELRKLYLPDYLEVDQSITNMTLREYLQREGELIFKHFGNHPSFMMFTLGNELGGSPAMYELVENFRSIDPRRLYAQGSNYRAWDPTLTFNDGDDFWVTKKTKYHTHIVRGSSFIAEPAMPQPHIENSSPSTLVDYSEAIADVPAPVIGHETGQFQVSPDFNEIPKYTGVLRARNYEIFRERLEEANMLDQSDDFVRASGKLAVITYKEDIEAALRTPDFGGFQLLDIMDFPGQGTAPVGILNVFMESKGLISPEEWRQFCSEVVPLLKMKKYTWTNEEQFEASIELAHYGKEDFKDAVVTWKLENEKGIIHHDGQFNLSKISRGGLAEIGELSFPLDVIHEAEQLKIVISVDGTPYKNTYPIWVYTENVNTTIPEGVMVSRRLDPETKKHLLEGGKAIIIPNHDRLPQSIGGAFQTDFWCWPMFVKASERVGAEIAPGSLGFICDPDSPLLAHFPTEFHSNWQWWQLVKNSRPLILDDTPKDYRPLIQTIDNFDRNHKLGMVFETKYGKGNLLVCAIDLPILQDHPEARQLYHSMLKYVESNNFTPETELSERFLHKILPN